MSSENKLQAFIILTGLLAFMGCLVYSILTAYIKRQDLIQRQQLERAAARVRINLEDRQLQQELHRQQQEDVEDPVAKSLRLVQILDSLNFETLRPKTDTSIHKDESRGTVESNTVKAAKESNVSLLERLFSATKQEQAAECCICLEPYKDGQVICSAKTAECDHMFHEVCALQWLQDHPECPLCRVTLIETEHG
jgi:hypothetical protein